MKRLLMHSLSVSRIPFLYTGEEIRRVPVVYAGEGKNEVSDCGAPRNGLRPLGFSFPLPRQFFSIAGQQPD